MRTLQGEDRAKAQERSRFAIMTKQDAFLNTIDSLLVRVTELESELESIEIQTMGFEAIIGFQKLRITKDGEKIDSLTQKLEDSELHVSQLVASEIQKCADCDYQSLHQRVVELEARDLDMSRKELSKMCERLGRDNDFLRIDRDSLTQKLNTLAASELSLNGRLVDAMEALALIATPKRPDGTYNRSREACERLARETIYKIKGKTP